MQKKQKQYKIGIEAEKLIREVRLSVRRFSLFFTTIPKNKNIRMIWLIETLSWILLGIALVWRLLGNRW